MKRFQLLATRILVIGLLGACACSRDDDASTTTTTSAIITPARDVVRARPHSSVYHPERELISPDRATTTSMPAVAPVKAADPPATAAGTRTAPREGDPLTAPSPVGPGGFAASPLDTAGGFVPGPLDTARGFGPARVDPSRAFTPAPLDTGFRGPDVVGDDPTGGPMRPSGASGSFPR